MVINGSSSHIFISLPNDNCQIPDLIVFTLTGGRMLNLACIIHSIQPYWLIQSCLIRYTYKMFLVFIKCKTNHCQLCQELCIHVLIENFVSFHSATFLLWCYNIIDAAQQTNTRYNYHWQSINTSPDVLAKLACFLIGMSVNWKSHHPTPRFGLFVRPLIRPSRKKSCLMDTCIRIKDHIYLHRGYMHHANIYWDQGS